MLKYSRGGPGQKGAIFCLQLSLGFTVKFCSFTVTQFNFAQLDSGEIISQG